MYRIKLYSHAVIWLLLCPIIICSSANAQKTAETKGVFYAITGKGLKDTSYLFGTYHLLKNSYLNQLQPVTQSFAKAQGLVVEVVIDSAQVPEENKKMLLEKDSLSGLLDKGFYDSLNAELKQTFGVGAAAVNNLKPAAVSATLAMVYVMQHNASLINKYNGKPLDLYFADEAKQAGKNITPLETVSQQMELLFVKTSLEKQVYGLKMFLRGKQKMAALGDSLFRAYLNNNLDEMYNIYQETLVASKEEDYLVKDRNAEWMKVLPGLISNRPRFIAVGALHLAGPYGLVAQLKNLGYTVTPINIHP